MNKNHNIYTKIWILDTDNLKQEVINGLNNGMVNVYDGVVYWAKQSGNKGIIQHLPFKEIVIDKTDDVMSLAKSIQGLQATTLGVVGLSTCIILGALIIQTQYLSSKIDKLQETIDILAAEIHSQNIIYYMDKISSYFGAIESARILLLDKSIKEEIRDIAASLLANIACKRNELFSFLDNILSIAHVVSPNHYELIVDFVHLVLDILPKAIYIEKELYARIDKINAAEFIFQESRTHYTRLLEMYKSWCNQQYKDSINGKLPQSYAIAFLRREEKVANLFKSKENTLLLSTTNQNNS